MARVIKNAYYKAVGNSSQDVTGSCHLIRFDKYTLLLDYGMCQTNNPLEDYKANKTRHKDIKPKEIDYIFLSHIHTDHCGMLPYLYKYGCTAPIIAPIKVKKLLRIILLDSVKIMKKECETYNRRDIPMTQLYDEADVEEMMKYVVEYEFSQKHILDENLKFTFYGANHIVNAAQIVLEICDHGVIKKIGYTGDIGSPKQDKKYIHSFEPIEQVDLLIGECTYSNNKRVHKKKDREKDIEKLKTVVNECVQSRGKLLIPVFSLNRLEDILSIIYDTYHNDANFKIPVIVDTPLGQAIANEWVNVIYKDHDYWNKVWSWSNLQKPETHKESVAWQDLNGTMIIVSSGGMLSAGRAVGWAQKLLPHKNNHLLFSGFTSRNSLASQIKNYKDYAYVKIDNQSVKNNAQVSVLNSFSSHADHDELLEYYSTVRCNKIALVHSEMESKREFGNELKKMLSQKDRTARVIITNQDTKVMI